MSRLDEKTLNGAINDLKSDKETVREKGVKNVREAFSHPSAFARFNKTSEPKGWMIIFQGLLEAYQNQRKRCISKLGSVSAFEGAGSSDRSVARLTEISSTLRYMISNSKEYLDTAEIKVLLKHLPDGIIYQGNLVTAVASDFAHAIESLLSWRPHLQAMPDSMWHTILAISFNTVLGRPPRRTLADHLDEQNPEEASEYDEASESDLSSPVASSSNPPRQTRGVSSASLKRPRRDSVSTRGNVRPGLSTGQGAVRQPISMQAPFMRIVTLLLRSPTAPILSYSAEVDKEEPHSFPRRLLTYFSHFLRVHAVDSSLRHDYLSGLSATLSHYTLNCRLHVAVFSADVWESLVAMWSAKDGEKSDDVVIILRMLFPVLTAEPLKGEPTVGRTKALRMLWQAAEVIGSRNSLNIGLDSLQSRVTDGHDCANAKQVFTSRTFQYGWGLSRTRALAWTALELQADCAEMIHLHSESSYSTPTSGRKKQKLENPIVALLHTIQSPTPRDTKIRHLQVLLFFAERHWLVLDEQLRKDFITSLTSLVSFEDADIQSWTFMCLAAIAHADCAAPPSSAVDHHPASDLAVLWDPVWTHAMRRANVPAVSRAACHAAHVLLLHSKRLLSSQRVLGEIESFVKDLDVQGPAYPYDSVCSFMVLCLRFANQDVRLYRMQMEEKVLSWLTEAWRIDVGRRTAMPMHTVAHIHALLEAITGSSRRVRLRCDIMLPPCPIVDAMVEEIQTRVIRDFQLHARLPPYEPSHSTASTAGALPASTPDGGAERPLVEDVDTADLSPPRGRERRISAFLLKSLEAMTTALGASLETFSKPTVETLRSSLDFAVSALFFEASLILNGIQSNRRVIQASCKLVGTVAPSLSDQRWEAHERRLLLGALDPVVLADDDNDDQASLGWEALVAPGERTGIRTEVLHRLLSSPGANHTDRALRHALQKAVFRSADVQDAFADLLKGLRDVLRMTIERSASKSSRKKADDFAPALDTSVSAEAAQKLSAIATHDSHIVRSCISALTVVPILQSSSGEPTHDRELSELVSQCESDQYLVIAPPFLDEVEHRRLHLSRSTIKEILLQVGDLCSGYAYKNNVSSQLLVVRSIEATAHLWRGPTMVEDPEVGGVARFYCMQCVRILKKTSQRSWRVRDAIIRFLDKHLALDPKQEGWSMPDGHGDHPSPGDFPAAILPTFGLDVDIRIRFRVAAASPRLFTVGRLAGRDSMDVYTEIRTRLSTDEERFEHILTRFLSLGNMVISEASVRRGAYWHLLEISFFQQNFNPYLKATLMGITTRLGMERFADLFNCYSSQFAYSMRAANIDIFRFPPDLLGYRDRRECAEVTFRAFTPTNLLGNGMAEEVETGKDLFSRHCQAIQKSEEDVIRECFPELIAHQIVFWLDRYGDADDQGLMERELDGVLMAKTRLVKREELFRQLLQQNVDHVVVSILRTLEDNDVSGNGPIVAALQLNGADVAVETFLSITKYRVLDTFDAHKPNLPCYGTHTVLRALVWYCSRVQDGSSPAVTYHVLHHLFADIERSPLVNEQYRLLNALCLWISCHHVHFQDTSLLRVLMRRTTALFAQSDLAHSAQSLLEWSLSLYKTHVAKPDHRLADILIRTSTLAHEFLETTKTSYLVELGTQLMAWVETQADSLRKSKSLRKLVIRALAAWPRELPPSLRSACDNLHLPDLLSALKEHGVSSSKFRLVRKIYDVASRENTTNTGGGRDFGSSDFWRLKACIPPREYLVDSDIDAFTSLLVLHHGRIDSLGSEQFAPETVCSRHRKSAEAKPVASHVKGFAPRADIDLARSAIILSLLAMLDTSPAPQVHVVYTTLRAVMSVPSSETFVDATLPSETRRELDYMRAFREPRLEHAAPDLPSIFASEETVHLASDFPGWITRVATLLCDTLGTRDAFFSPLSSLLRTDHAFAEDVLPVLCHSLLQIEFDDHAHLSPTSLKTLLSNYLSSVLAYDDADVSCHRAIINVVLHLRSFHPSHPAPPPPSSKEGHSHTFQSRIARAHDALAHDKWLSIDFALLGSCAIKCGAYTTALLFLELAKEHPRSKVGSENISTEAILFEIYSHIDEPDGFYGIQTDDLRNFLVRRLRHENQWDKAFRYHGAVLESGASGATDTDGIVQALYSFGFNNLAMKTLQQFSDSDNSLGTGTLAYNLGWRAETWDLPDTLASDDSGETLYLAMRAVYRERNGHVVDSVTRRAFMLEMQRLRDLGGENFTEIRRVAQNLMCLSQIRQWRGSEAQMDLRAGTINGDRWRSFTSLEPEFDFGNIEAIMTTRISLIRSLRQKEQREQIGDLLSPFCAALLDLEKTCLLCLSERARDANEVQVSLNSITRAQALEKHPSSSIAREFSNVLWLMKEPKLAIKALGALVTPPTEGMLLDDVPSRLQNASLMAQLGTWSAEASMKKPSQIVTDCFTPAADIILAADIQSAVEKDGSVASIFHQYAIFAERQYHAISKSPDALRWKLYIDRKKEEMKRRAVELKRAQHNNSADFRSLFQQQQQADKLLRQDQERAKEQLGQRTSFLSLAVEMYSRCLSASDSFDDDSPIRLCSLWLANFDSDDATLRFEEALARVPSRKFVFLAHQLTARLWNPEQGAPSPNQSILQGIIQRMCREHPFHTLFPLYCLKVDRAASQASSSRRQSGRHASQSSSQMERGVAATDLFNKLRADPLSSERVRNVELVCDASLQWAKYPIKGKTIKDNKVPDDLLIRQIKHVKVPVITAHTPIDPTTRYEDCAWIDHFDTQYTTAGGVNLPKIINCRGYDGKYYKQLYKGEGDDDLRQDAVMEQVFDLVNIVLRRDRETKRRNLSVRGYKVIPLDPQAGVLEFVENTMPLATWLLPAHIRYRPKDLSDPDLRRFITGASKTEWHDNPEGVIQRFLQSRETYKPVMRHYFTEKHKTPMSWYTMRLHYARSVATNSIVGHVLGVGDRHTSNILIDNKTGEVVHIDLGIAFEQGKLLPQPERVPFRLTADMVDGLGISGTQGVFQRCAEETLRVLRDGSEIILTVLEVFKYDPLHSWTASELKIKRAQASVPDETAQLTGEAFRFAIGIDMASGAADEAADRALSAVARKLDKTLSVEYTVNELITEASDPSNLALMYIGWAPYW